MTSEGWSSIPPSKVRSSSISPSSAELSKEWVFVVASSVKPSGIGESFSSASSAASRMSSGSMPCAAREW